MNLKKPPLGVMPLYLWNEGYGPPQTSCERLAEVNGAIRRYRDAGLPVNPKWILEVVVNSLPAPSAPPQSPLS
jgi:hypothetical protein